jgi:uncharacterized protein
VALIGEAKHRDRRPGLAELRRLQHLRDLPTATGHEASDAGEIHLVTLDEIYGRKS